MSPVLLEYRCPRCGKHNDEADVYGSDNQSRPTPGDIGICIGCAAPLAFRAAQPPRWLTYEEIKAFPNEQRARLIQAVLMIVTHQPSTLDRMPWR